MYNKLFTKILDSSIWMEPMPTRIVWLTFIAAMDEDGFVQFASTQNVAHRARVSDDEAIAAIAALEGPDPNSSNPANEGRRIERVAGGWIVLNAKDYRALVTREVIKTQTRDRVARFREKKRTCNASVTRANEKVTPSEADTDTEAEKKKDSRFAPPSDSELSLEAEKIGLPQTEVFKFQAYYDSNGWKVGKNKMKDWRKALVGWKLRWDENRKPTSPERGIDDPESVYAIPKIRTPVLD